MDAHERRNVGLVVRPQHRSMCCFTIRDKLMGLEGHVGFATPTQARHSADSRPSHMWCSRETSAASTHHSFDLRKNEAV